MSIKGRSIVSFGLIVVFVLIMGVFQQQNAKSQLEQVHLMKEKTLQTTLLADEMKLAVVQVQQYLTDISATRALDNLDDGFEQAEEYSKIFYKDLEQVKNASGRRGKIRCD